MTGVGVPGVWEEGGGAELAVVVEGEESEEAAVEEPSVSWIIRHIQSSEKQTQSHSHDSF